MNKTHAKRQRDIKTKLMAAICMLLVSSIMMVSTTYAWFTLSTAPEVTGITTAVGANGNLEMALLPKDGRVQSITSEAGDSVKDIEERNVTWGNLVDVSDTTIYGLDQITLYPSALNLTDDGKVDVSGFILETPKYGADGRVSELVANAVTGYFNQNTKNFVPNSEYGVRAVGAASGMTDRQLSYRNARSAANTARAMAANLASNSLNNNGSSLANIAIEYGMGADTAEFTQTDVASLRKIIDDLQKDGGILDQIETAYMQYILAYAASAATGETDTVWQAVSGAVEAEGATLESVVNAIGSDKLPTTVANGIAKYTETVAAVAQADAALKDLEDDGSDAKFTWAQIKTPMEPLANPAQMEINGFKASEVKENLGALVTSVTEQGGLRVIMGTGAGVYADIADQSGDYNASITIERVEYNGIVLNNMKARMETNSSLDPNFYLVVVGTAVENAGAPTSGSAGATLPISDMYGYIIDMAFRTNAAESDLLLQVEAADRIYADDNTNENTMGGGSSMTFMATTTDFSDDQVKSLMDAIKIVFFDPHDGTIYCYAGLDTANATRGADGLTAKMYLYKIVAGETTYTQKDYDPDAGNTVTYYKKTVQDVYTATTDISDRSKEYYATNDNGATFTLIADNTTLVEGNTYYLHSTKDVYTEQSDDQAKAASVGELYVATTAPSTKEEIDDDAIMALTQNQATALSVLVYLDGEVVTNASVAATGSSSMTGSMNLQFASSANLVPMEYADLHIPGAAETVNVTVPAGVTGAAKAEKGKDYTFTVSDGYTLGTVTVGGTTVTPTDNGSGSYTIPAANVTGDIVITVTGGTAVVETVNVTVPTGVTGATTATKNVDYTFTVDTANYTLDTVTVGGANVTPTDNGSGSYTILADQVTGDIVITVTAATTGT